MMITVKVTVLQRKTLRGIREITDRDNAHSARVFTLSAIIVLSTVATKVVSAPKASGPVCNKTPNSAAIVLITIAITAVTSPVSSIVLAISRMMQTVAISPVNSIVPATSSPMVNIRRVSPVQSSRAISVAVTSSVAVISSVVAAISSVVVVTSSVVVAISSVAVTSSAAAVTSSVVAVTSRVAAISSVDTIRMLLATTPMPNIV